MFNFFLNLNYTFSVLPNNTNIKNSTLAGINYIMKFFKQTTTGILGLVATITLSWAD